MDYSKIRDQVNRLVVRDFEVKKKREYTMADRHVEKFRDIDKFPILLEYKASVRIPYDPNSDLSTRYGKRVIAESSYAIKPKGGNKDIEKNFRAIQKEMVNAFRENTEDEFDMKDMIIKDEDDKLVIKTVTKPAKTGFSFVDPDASTDEDVSDGELMPPPPAPKKKRIVANKKSK